MRRKTQGLLLVASASVGALLFACAKFSGEDAPVPPDPNVDAEVPPSMDGAIDPPDSPTDGPSPRMDAPVVAPRCDQDGPFSALEAVAFGSINNNGFDEESPTLTRDELVLYYASNSTGNFKIYRATRSSKSEAFSIGIALTGGINDNAVDRRDPVVAPNETTLYFTALNGTAGYDVMRSERAAASNTWTIGTAIPGAVNTAANEAVGDLADGFLYFARGTSIQRAAVNGNVFAPVEAYTLVGGAAVRPKVQPLVKGEGTIYWEGFSTPDAASGDIYGAYVGSKGFAPIGPAILSHPGAEDAPGWVSPDGCALYLHSRRNGTSDLYVATRGFK